MAFAHSVLTTHGFSPASSKPKRGFFRALLDAMMLARQQQADREIARYLASTGGKFTDESERTIERLMMKRTSW